MFKPIVKENFFSKEECEWIVGLITRRDIWEPRPEEPWWDKRGIHHPLAHRHFGNAYIRFLKEKTEEVQRIIKEEYGLEKEVYPDCAALNKWPTGWAQSPHSDDMKAAGVTGFETRVFGSLIYLNDNFEGGQLYYPKQNFYVTPKPGMLAIHPGDEEHLHGVTEITSGTRYTISSLVWGI